MKVITCASYYGTGSSAVTDLISQYDSVYSLTDYEIRFIHEIDCISDLEFHLVESPNRHNSGHALKRFERISRFFAGSSLHSRYEPFFSGKYLELTKRYINDLIDFKIKGNRFADWYDKGIVFYYFQSIIKKISKILHYQINGMPKTYQYYSHPSQEKFLSCTRKYTSELLKAANKTDAEIILVDQLLPSSNINRCLRYFSNNVFVLVVDRDPRDVFLLNKYVWKDSQVPYDAMEFCKWFKYTHELDNQSSWSNTNVLKINFEDLIYKYQETKIRIEQFLGIDYLPKDNEFSIFNPKRSVVNTQLWNRFHDEDNLRIIERELAKYLYNYSSCINNEIPGKQPTSIRNF